jgi:hypothetical protein
MSRKKLSKTDIYKAVGFVTILIASAIPASFLGMRALNYFLGAL